MKRWSVFPEEVETPSPREYARTLRVFHLWADTAEEAAHFGYKRMLEEGRLVLAVRIEKDRVYLRVLPSGAVSKAFKGHGIVVPPVEDLPYFEVEMIFEDEPEERARAVPALRLIAS